MGNLRDALERLNGLRDAQVVPARDPEWNGLPLVEAGGFLDRLQEIDLDAGSRENEIEETAYHGSERRVVRGPHGDASVGEPPYAFDLECDSDLSVDESDACLSELDMLDVDPRHSQMVTTDQSTVEDPVAVANELTGWFDEDPAEEESQTSTSRPFASDAQARSLEPSEFERNAASKLRLPGICAQFEEIWTNLRDGCPEETSTLVGLISVESEDHASSVMGHLALWLAREKGNQVLLVDGDSNRRRLSAQFGLRARAGLSEVCLMECDWTEAVVPTSSEGMSILPAGIRRIHSGDFDPIRLPIMANGWKAKYDVVLVDIGDAQSAVSRPLNMALDRSYLLIRLGQTPRDLADDMMDTLLDDDVPLKGCIVTNMP